MRKTFQKQKREAVNTTAGWLVRPCYLLLKLRQCYFGATHFCQESHQFHFLVKD
jgi:hypothetical protein